MHQHRPITPHHHHQSSRSLRISENSSCSSKSPISPFPQCTHSCSSMPASRFSRIIPLPSTRFSSIRFLSYLLRWIRSGSLLARSNFRSSPFHSNYWHTPNVHSFARHAQYAHGYARHAHYLHAHAQHIHILPLHVRF